MSTIEHRIDFLKRLYGVLNAGCQCTAEEIVILREQREVIFGGNMRRVLNIAEAFVDSYDQLIRDKCAVRRRYEKFAERVGKQVPIDFTPQMEEAYRLEAMSIAHHADIVTEFSEDMNDEINRLLKEMERIRDFLNSSEERIDGPILGGEGHSLITNHPSLCDPSAFEGFKGEGWKEEPDFLSEDGDQEGSIEFSSDEMDDDDTEPDRYGPF